MAPGDTTVEFSRRCRHCGEPLDAASSFCSKCGATAEHPGARPDTLRDQLIALFGDELDIERELGRGGMAAVFAAYDPGLQRRVAVKVLLPEIANDRSASDRFLREARTVASLQHPHVVTVYAVKSRDGVHAIVMQFVEGRSLDATLHERGSLTLPVAGLILAQAAEGLQHAHDRGVIHRDVKPANVLIEHDGRAIVSDFGIARRESGPRTTETGLVVGTWAYMSPEQRNAEMIGPATDQYALGVMAFELLSGRLPFTGTAMEMLRGHLHDPPPSLRTIRPNTSAELEAVINRMLSKDPAARFPSLKEPERAFRALVANVGQTTLQLAAYSQVREKVGSQVVAAVARPPVSAVSRAEAPTKRTASVPQGPQAVPQPPATVRQRPARNLAPLIGAGIGVAVLGIGWLVLKDKGSQPPSVQTPSVQAPAASAPAQSPSSSDANTRPTQQGATQQPRATPGAETNAGTSLAGGAVAPRALNPVGSDAPPQSKTTVPSLPATEPTPERPAPATKAEPPPAASSTPAIPSATRADAQKLAREFVTMLNQRRFRELGQIPSAGGDAAARAELLRLTETAANFIAGFDRVASAPQMSPQGFETDFDVGLEWRGGTKVLRVLLYAVPAEGGGWRVAGVAVSPAG